MERLLVAIISVVALASIPAGTAFAAEPSPGHGPAFGHHAASMAREHARDGGQHFGACISAMARGETCPHAH